MRMNLQWPVSIVLLTMTCLFSGCKGGAQSTKDFFFPSERPGGKPSLKPGASLQEIERLNGFSLSVETYANCQEVQEDWSLVLRAAAANAKARNEYFSSNRGSITSDGAITISSIAVEDSAQGGTENYDVLTNVQEKGVDEPDFVKVNSTSIFVQSNEGVRIIRRNGLTQTGKIDLSDLLNSQLFVDHDRLIVLGEKKILLPEDGIPQSESYSDNSHGNDGISLVRIYGNLTATSPTMLKEHTFSGRIKDSRFVNGHLVLVFSMELPLTFRAQQFRDGGYGTRMNAPFAINIDSEVEESPTKPILVKDDKISDVACANISKPHVYDQDYRLTKVISVNTRRVEDAPNATAAIGGGDQIYMTNSSLFLTKQGLYWTPWINPGAAAERERIEQIQRDMQNSLLISKFSFDPESGSIVPSANGLIVGRVKDQWAFKELTLEGRSYLAVATSTGALWDRGDNIAQNHLWLLTQEESNLSIKSAIQNFGTGEDIRSVRYVGKIAYVVTFKKTDPLFAFDISNPDEPKLLDELKIPGFSTYMHPIAGNKMVGIGFDAQEAGDFAWYQGLKISLFDIKDSSNLSELDHTIIGERGSYSDATGDHHAFFYDEKLELFAIPAVELVGRETNDGPMMATTVKFSGAIVMAVEDGKIVERGRISHQDMMPAECRDLLSNGRWWEDKAKSHDINRIFTVDGRLLTISRFGIKAFLPSELGGSPDAEIKFELDDKESDTCQLYSRY